MRKGRGRNGNENTLSSSSFYLRVGYVMWGVVFALGRASFSVFKGDVDGKGGSHTMSQSKHPHVSDGREIVWMYFVYTPILGGDRCPGGWGDGPWNARNLDGEDQGNHTILHCMPHSIWRKLTRPHQPHPNPKNSASVRPALPSGRPLGRRSPGLGRLHPCQECEGQGRMGAPPEGHRHCPR